MRGEYCVLFNCRAVDLKKEISLVGLPCICFEIIKAAAHLPRRVPASLTDLGRRNVIAVAIFLCRRKIVDEYMDLIVLIEGGGAVPRNRWSFLFRGVVCLENRAGEHTCASVFAGS